MRDPFEEIVNGFEARKLNIMKSVFIGMKYHKSAFMLSEKTGMR
jgi:hypothetical protein